MTAIPVIVSAVAPHDMPCVKYRLELWLWCKSILAGPAEAATNGCSLLALLLMYLVLDMPLFVKQNLQV